MKKEILNFIHCPKCETELILQNSFQNDIEIEQAELFCQNCRKKFTVNKGIVFLCNEFSSEVEKERDALTKEISEKQDELEYQNEDWLMSFPDNKGCVSDTRENRIINFISENTINSLKKFIQSRNLSILEIGAGNCWLTNRLAKDNYCIALDMFHLAPKGLEFGNLFIKNKKSYFERVLADMVKLPFKNKSFDLVIISSSLHHSSNLSKTLTEISRVLKDEGKLLLFNEPSTGLIAGKERRQIEIDINNGVNEQRYTLNEWKNAINKSGFKIKFYLPENIINILQHKKGIYKFIGLCLAKFPKIILNTILLLMAPIILRIFDGFFNAVVFKK